MGCEWESKRKVKDSLWTSISHQINWNRLINLFFFSSLSDSLSLSFLLFLQMEKKKYDYELNFNHFSKVKIELCNFKWHENEIIVISVSVFFHYLCMLYNSIMFGWLRNARSNIISRNVRWASVSFRNASKIFLTATVFCVRLSIAFHTIPYAPLPKRWNV